MSDAYTKLFSSITTSTIWMEPAGTRLVWITMLALKRRDQCVYASVPGLADAAKVTRKECDAALRTFLAPDIDSRTKDHDGRRIEEIDGGWIILNGDKFDTIRSTEERREYMREYMREKRANEKLLTESLANVAEVSPSSTSTSTNSKKQDQKQERAQPSAARPPCRFDEFWKLYPNKKGSVKATRAKWVREKLDAKADEIMAHVRLMIASDDGWGRGYVPTGATYVNQERWTDVPAQPCNRGSNHGQHKETYAARITRKAIAERASAALDRPERPDDAGPVDLDVGVLLGKVVKQIR